MKISAKAALAALFVAILMMAIGCGPSETEKKAKSDRAEARKTPEITWKDVAFIDTIQQGDTVIRNFVFYNTGWKPVVIKHALPNRPECTCRVPQREVLIGEQDTVQLRCVFKDFESRASVEIIVEHNTPQPEPVLVYMGSMFRD
jgi:hypothetical protein